MILCFFNLLSVPAVHPLYCWFSLFYFSYVHTVMLLKISLFAGSHANVHICTCVCVFECGGQGWG